MNTSKESIPSVYQVAETEFENQSEDEPEPASYETMRDIVQEVAYRIGDDSRTYNTRYMRDLWSEDSGIFTVSLYKPEEQSSRIVSILCTETRVDESMPGGSSDEFYASKVEYTVKYSEDDGLYFEKDSFDSPEVELERVTNDEAVWLLNLLGDATWPPKTDSAGRLIAR